MNCLRFLVFAVFGFSAAPSYAVLVVFTLQGEPFAEWEFAQWDFLSREITSIDIADADGDGRASLIAEVAPQEIGVAVHSTTGPDNPGTFIGKFRASASEFSPSTFPFVQDVDGDSLIVEWLGFSSVPFSISQPVTVFNGTIAGLDGLVRENLGITTAADLLAIDVGSLPTFTGAAEVVGLLTVEVIPEPSTATLVLLAMAGIGVIRRHKRIKAQSKGSGLTDSLDGVG